MSNRTSRLALCLLLLPWPARAGTDSPSVPLTLQGAIDYALGHHARVRIGAAKVESSLTRMEEAQGEYWPSVRLLSDTYRVEVRDSFTGINATSATYNGVPVSVSLTRSVPPYQLKLAAEARMNLYSGGRTMARQNEAQAENEASLAELSLTQNQVLLDVVGAYWRFKLSQARKHDAAARLAMAKEEAHAAQLRYRQGRIDALAKETADLQLFEADIQHATTLKQLAKDWRAYLNVLNFESTPAIPETSLPDSPAEVRVESPRFENEALPLELAKMEALLKKAKARKEVESADFHSQWELYTRYGLVGRNESDPWNAVGNLHRDDWVVGLRMEWNIFNGFRDTQRVKRAELETQITHMQLAEKRREIATEQKNNLERIEECEHARTLAERRLQLAEMERNIAKTKFENDRISKIDYQRSELSLNEARTDVLGADIDLMMARLAQKLDGPSVADSRMPVEDALE